VNGDRYEQNIYMIDHAPCPGQNLFVTRMLMRDILR